MDSNPCSPNGSKIYRGLRLPPGWNGDKGLTLTMHLHSKTPTHFYLEFIYLRRLRVKITCSPSGPTMGLSFSLGFFIHNVGMPVSCGLVSFIYSGHNTRNSESPTKHSKLKFSPCWVSFDSDLQLPPQHHSLYQLQHLVTQLSLIKQQLGIVYSKMKGTAFSP